MLCLQKMIVIFLSSNLCHHNTFASPCVTIPSYHTHKLSCISHNLCTCLYQLQDIQTLVHSQSKKWLCEYMHLHKLHIHNNSQYYQTDFPFSSILCINSFDLTLKGLSFLYTSWKQIGFPNSTDCHSSGSRTLSDNPTLSAKSIILVCG